MAPTLPPVRKSAKKTLRIWSVELYKGGCFFGNLKNIEG